MISRLPPIVIFVLTLTVLVLLALCAAAVYVALRVVRRFGVAQWPIWRVLVLVAAAGLPWFVVVFAPISIGIDTHSIGPLLGWVLIALVVFALLVPFPLCVLVLAVKWCSGWIKRRSLSETRSAR